MSVVNARRIGTFAMWTLAILLPGGLPILAVYLSVRAARAQTLLSTPRASVVPATSLHG